MTVNVQPTLDGSVPKSRTQQRIDDYDTWVELVRPTFVEVAQAGTTFLFWKIAEQYDLPDPPDRDHDWGRFAASLHKDGVTRTAGFGLTRDKSGVRRWQGTRAAIEGRAS